MALSLSVSLSFPLCHGFLYCMPLSLCLSVSLSLSDGWHCPIADNEAYSMFEDTHSKDADFNANKLTAMWKSVGRDSEVVVGPHPLNVETEMTVAEFSELLARVGLIKTKVRPRLLARSLDKFRHVATVQLYRACLMVLLPVCFAALQSMKKELNLAERVELFLHEFFLACNQRIPVKVRLLPHANCAEKRKKKKKRELLEIGATHA